MFLINEIDHFFEKSNVFFKSFSKLILHWQLLKESNITCCDNFRTKASLRRHLQLWRQNFNKSNRRLSVEWHIIFTLTTFVTQQQSRTPKRSISCSYLWQQNIFSTILLVATGPLDRGHIISLGKCAYTFRLIIPKQLQGFGDIDVIRTNITPIKPFGASFAKG